MHGTGRDSFNTKSYINIKLDINNGGRYNFVCFTVAIFISVSKYIHARKTGSGSQRSTKPLKPREKKNVCQNCVESNNWKI